MMNQRKKFRGGIVVSAMAALTLTAMCASADTITLKPEVYVKGPSLLLGDLADIDSDNKDTLAALEVAPAALPGSTKQLNLELVSARLHNLADKTEGLEVTGAQTVRATTLHQELTRDAIATDLRDYIEVNMPWDPADTIIDVTPPYQDVVLPEGRVSIRWNVNPRYRYAGTGAFRGEILVDGEMKDAVQCRANVESYSEVLVAAADIPRGTLIKSNHLTMEKRANSELRGLPCRDEAEVVGKVARSTIFPGQVVELRKLMARKVIERNQIVIALFSSGGLSVQIQGRATTDGCEGDLITCENAGSKEEFVGVVQADGTVLVQ